MRGRKRISKGMTLMELLLAVSATAVIGAAVVGTGFALASAQDNSDTYSECVQTSRVAMGRLTSMLRESQLVTGTDANGIVLWTGDPNGNQRINLSELAAILYDEDTKEIIQYQIVFPEGWPPVLVWLLDVSISLKDVPDPAYCAWYVGNSPYGMETVLASDVFECEFSVSPSPPFSRFVSIQVTTSQGESQIEVCGAAVLRADQTNRIVQVGQQYLLDTDPQGGWGWLW